MATTTEFTGIGRLGPSAMATTMRDDQVRSAGYAAAIAAHLPGKVVLDIGTGALALLAVMHVRERRPQVDVSFLVDMWVTRIVSCPMMSSSECLPRILSKQLWLVELRQDLFTTFTCLLITLLLLVN